MIIVILIFSFTCKFTTIKKENHDKPPIFQKHGVIYAHLEVIIIKDKTQ